MAIILALALGAAAVALSDAQPADAAACPSPTTTIAGTGPATATTLAPTTTTTTLATTTTSTTTTSSTTTTIPLAPDLTPNLVNVTGDPLSQQYRISITNIGDAPTTGPMTFDLTLEELLGPGPILPDLVTSADWTSVGTPSGLRFTSNDGLAIAPGATSVVTLLLEWRADVGGAWRGTLTLPSGIGGETNAANNIHSIAVVIDYG